MTTHKHRNQGFKSDSFNLKCLIVKPNSCVSNWSICLSDCLSACLLHPYLCLLACLSSDCLDSCLSVCLPHYHIACLFLCLSGCLPVFMSAFPITLLPVVLLVCLPLTSVSLPACLSVCTVWLSSRLPIVPPDFPAFLSAVLTSLLAACFLARLPACSADSQSAYSYM